MNGRTRAIVTKREWRRVHPKFPEIRGDITSDDDDGDVDDYIQYGIDNTGEYLTVETTGGDMSWETNGDGYYVSTTGGALNIDSGGGQLTIDSGAGNLYITQDFATGLDIYIDSTNGIYLTGHHDGIYLNPAAGFPIDLEGITAFSGRVSPAQITANQDDYNPTNLNDANQLRLSSDASRNITGLAGGQEGRVILVHNVGSNNIVLKDESGSSTAANRFALVSDITLLPDSMALLHYDNVTLRWRCGGSGAITEASLSLSDNTTDDVSSTRHGFAPKSPGDATKFLNGAATPAYAQVKDSDLSTSDITTNDVSTTKHGFAPKAPNDTTKFLRGDATWAVPAGSGSGSKTFAFFT